MNCQGFPECFVLGCGCNVNPEDATPEMCVCCGERECDCTADDVVQAEAHVAECRASLRAGARS